MKNILILTILIGAFSLALNAQTVPATANASDDLADCSQMLDQSIEEVRACKDVVQKMANDKTLADRERDYYKDLTVKYEKRIAYLEGVTCSEFALFKIGIIKLFHYKKCK